MTQIQDRVAVITGGASGIGRGIAEQLIREGAKVVISDIDESSLRVTAQQIGALGVVADVTDPASVANLADRVLEHHGRVDIVVNNAGVGPSASFEELTLEDWRWMVNVNLWGVIHGVHTFLPYLISNPEGGHIVNTASFAIFNPRVPGLGAYTTAKFGVHGLSETLSQEMADSHPNVRVTVLPPGPVRTNISQSLRSRPQDESGALRDVDLTASDGADDLPWMDPLTAGAVVARAIRNNDSYAITHPQWWPMVQARHDRLQAEFEKYPPLA